MRNRLNILAIALMCIIAVCGCRKTPPTPTSTSSAGQASVVEKIRKVIVDFRGRISQCKITRPAIEKKMISFGNFVATEYRRWLVSPEFIISAADRQLAAGNTPQAIVLFRKAVEMFPENIDAIKGLANALMVVKTSDEKQKYKYTEEAIALHQKIIDRQADDLTSRFNKAVALMGIGRFSEAEELYEYILKKQPDNVEARYNLATIYQHNQNFGYAKDELKKVIELAPNLPSAHRSLGQIYMDLEQYDEAIDCFVAAKNLDEKNVSHWINLAVAFKAAGKLGNSVFAYKKAIELAPKDAELYAELGNTFLLLHRATKEEAMLAKAVDAWRTSLTLAPDQPKIRELVDLYSLVLPQTSTPTSQPE